MDNPLTRYYRSALSKCVWLITLLGIAVNVLIGWLATYFPPAHFLIDLAGRLLSLGVIAMLFLAAEKLIRTRLWKLAYPELDLSGRWSGASTYERCQVPKSPAELRQFKPFSRPNDVLLTQDCLSIVVSSAVAPGAKGSWHSLAAALAVLDTGPQVRYAYHVDYGGAEGFPHEATGYETLSVIAPAEGTRPTHLKGSFAHCAKGQKPVYSGTVAFERSETARKDSLPRRVLLWAATKLANFGKPSV